MIAAGFGRDYLEGSSVRIALSEHLASGPAAERLALARQLGADGVELLLGAYAPEQHLLWRPGGPAELRERAATAGVGLASVHAAYFSEHPLSDSDAATRRRHALILDRLLDACNEAGIATIVLPLLGRAELIEPEAFPCLFDVLAPLALKAAARGVRLAFAMPAPLCHLHALRSGLPGAPLAIAYNVGLAVTLGADPIVDVKLLGDALLQVRVGEVTADGRRTPLGQGVVPWAALKRLLGEQGFTGWCVLGGARGPDLHGAVRADLAFLRAS